LQASNLRLRVRFLSLFLDTVAQTVTVSALLFSNDFIMFGSLSLPSFNPPLTPLLLFIVIPNPCRVEALAEAGCLAGALAKANVPQGLPKIAQPFMAG
jgi:hypothetical protein